MPVPGLELSVVIPSYNRRAMLRRCLEALAGQTQDPGSFEVVVADDGSGDGTAEMVEGLQTPFAIRLLKQRQGGWAAAQNAGIEASAGRICLLIDDDIIVSPQLVAEHIAGHDAGGCTIGLGPLTQTRPDARDWYADAFATEWNKHFEELARRPAGWMDCYGGNLSAPRAALLEAGGFATDLAAAADIELAFRLCEAGCVPRYFPNAEAVHDDQKRGERQLEDARRRAVAYVQIADRHPQAEGDLLGWFRTGSGREIAARRLLIALRVSPHLLAALGRAIPSPERRIFWLHLVQRFGFWRSVREQVGRDRWGALTRLETGPPEDTALEWLP
jgi:glycosyltransferase involved in cell wall biosynthesis